MGKRIWVATSGLFLHSAVAATTLKGVCDRAGISYETARRKKGTLFTIDQGKGLKACRWTLQQMELHTVSGRGRRRFT